MDNKKKELAEYRLKETEAAFRSGEALLKIDDYRGAINRFYYAAFYAVQALLILKGKDARSHSGNLHLFREEYIRTGIFPQETNKTLSQLFEERLESDYGFIGEPTQEEAKEAQENCDNFLKKTRKVFDALL